MKILSPSWGEAEVQISADYSQADMLDLRYKQADMLDLRGGTEPGPSKSLRPNRLETTQGQTDGFFGQLPCRCYLPEVASVGD